MTLTQTNKLQQSFSIVLMSGYCALGMATTSAQENDQVPVVPVFNNEEAVTARCDSAITAAQATMDELLSAEKTSLLAEWDRSTMTLEDSIGPIYLQAYVHPDASVRKAGEACILKATQFETAIFQNPALYEAVLGLTPAKGAEAKFQQDLIEAFEDKGVALPSSKRERAAEILQKIQKNSQEFSRNIRENKTKITFPKSDLGGLPKSYLGRVKRSEEGGIEVGFDYPEVFPFLTYADSSEARKRYYIAFTQRGGARNIELLDEIVTLRNEYANLYEIDSYAELVIRRRMAGSEATVLEFLGKVRSTLDQPERADLFELRTLKSELKQTPLGETRVDPWDKEYLLEKVRQARFNIDQEALRKYFPTPESRDWILNIAEELYGIQFEKLDTVSWHEDVEHYSLSDAESGKLIGAIYLDLYPREGKYKHAAAFGVRSGSRAINRLPATVLVTNFNREGLTHREVTTFLHEIGHALHGVLSATQFGNQAGTSVERDFVEAPSQMFEEWGKRKQTIDLLKRQCPSCPTMDQAMIDRLDAADRFGKGLHYSRQHLYASFDMALASSNPQPSMPTWVRLESASWLGHAEGSQFPGTFAHIAGGYAAGYYGYMWSEAIGLDMLSAFGDDLMNSKVGNRFRQQVLARGGEVSARKMVSEFLGRDVDYRPFFNEIQGRTR